MQPDWQEGLAIKPTHLLVGLVSGLILIAFLNNICCDIAGPARNRIVHLLVPRQQLICESAYLCFHFKVKWHTSSSIYLGYLLKSYTCMCVRLFACVYVCMCIPRCISWEVFVCMAVCVHGCLCAWLFLCKMYSNWYVCQFSPSYFISVRCTQGDMFICMAIAS